MVRGVAVSQSEAAPRYRFVIGALILAAHFSIGLNFTPVSSVLPLVIEDYDVSRAAAGLLVALPMLVKALIGLPGSVVIGRFGLKRVFTLSWFLLGSLALSAVAPNFSTMLVLRFIYGIGAGLMMPALASLVMQWFPPNEMAIMNSLGLVVMSLGIALSVAVAAPLAAFFAWPVVMGLFGLIGLVGAVAWSVYGETQLDSRETKNRISLSEVKSVLRDRTIVLLVVGDALVFIFYAALTSWLPTYLHEVRGMSLAQAGNITGLLPFVGMFAVLVGGYLTLKIRSKRLFFIGAGLLVGVGGFGTFLIEQPSLLLASVMIFGIGVWIYQPMLLTLPMQLPWMTQKKIAVVWGASLTVAGLGMFVSPIVVGASRDLFGSFVPGFIIWATLAWALFIAGLLLPQNQRDSS